MVGGEELEQLAHLLRLGADTARELASSMPDDAMEICELAGQAKAIADGLELIAKKHRHTGFN